MNGNVLHVSRARRGDSWDVCYEGKRIPLGGYKPLKKYLKEHYGGSGIELKSRGMSKKEVIPLERIVMKS